VGIDSTGSTGSTGPQDETPAATGDDPHRTARTQAGADDDRGHRRAETLTREQYADAMRADGPPVRPESPDALGPANGPANGSGPGDRRYTDEADGMADGDAPGLKDDHPAATVQGQSDRIGTTRAEPLTREENADAVRGIRPDDSDHGRAADTATEPDPAASAAITTVTHYHSEFKERPLDLYTDGTRWAAADTPRTQETVAEKGDIPDRQPTGEQLVESAGEGSSRLERLRREVYEESDDEADALEKEVNLAHDVFSHPPTSSYEGTPNQPHIYATQHSGIDAGSVATAIFTVGLVMDRVVHWAMGYYDKHAKGR
jgi:hypothetical protein